MGVAYVLGSGFSKGLDGPLLYELLGQPRWTRIQYKLNMNERHVALRDDVNRVLGLYYNTKATGPWGEDAEQFIEYLELAAAGSAHANYVQERLRAMDWNAAAAAKTAKRLLALVTHEFILDTDLNAERWEPYQRWAKSLREDDEVITFNYDLVVEKAYAHAYPGQELARTSLHSASGRLHKLHGSVDLFRKKTDTGWTEPPAAATPLTYIDDEDWEPMIGIPGNNKRSACEEMFDNSWDAAQRALASAHVIVFMGYRFPPSDAYAKRMLLSAIKDNEHDHITVRLVLGEQRDAAVLRLEGLLRWTLSDRKETTLEALQQDIMASRPKRGKTFTLIQEPMRAEDFMTVFDRDRMVSLL